MTVIRLVSATPSTVAEIAARPLSVAVTRPAVSIRAMVGFSLVQVTLRPPSTLPLELRADADNVAVSPTSSVVARGAMMTLATSGGGVTPTLTLPLPHPLVAVIVMLPTFPPVTVANAADAPVLSARTVATLESLLVHVINGYRSSRPFGSRTAAVSTMVSPIAPTVAGDGEIVVVPLGFPGGGEGISGPDRSEQAPRAK